MVVVLTCELVKFWPPPPPPLTSRCLCEEKIGALFSTVPGNELENEGRGATPPSQDPPRLSPSPSVHTV